VTRPPVYAVYEPLFVPRPVAEDVWIVDGDVVRMRWGALRVPFPTRMTLVRLPDGGLWVHSPVTLTESLRDAVSRLGPVRHLVSPNRLHCTWLADWQAAFPEATSFGLPDAEGEARAHGAHFETTLSDEPPPAWRDVLDQLVVPGGFMSEVAFFHRLSRTLILTDLIENFEPARVRSAFWRVLMRLSGAADPDGKMPIDLRLTFRRHKPAVGRAVRRMLDWQPERVILAHGRWYPHDGAAELRRAMRWAL
jgi:hypothetical protein